MCIGIPMRVEQIEGVLAVCTGRAERRRVNLMLVGPQPIGAWVLVQQDTAQRVLDEIEARRIGDALDGVEAVLRGETLDERLFADLVNRPPQLPDFLRK